MKTPGGSGSVTEKLVRSVSPGAKISIRNREFPPAGMEEGEKFFNPVICVPLTVTVAFAAVRLPIPWSVVKVFLGIVLVYCPEGVPARTITGTVIVHVPGFVGVPA